MSLYLYFFFWEFTVTLRLLPSLTFDKSLSLKLSAHSFFGPLTDCFRCHYRSRNSSVYPYKSSQHCILLNHTCMFHTFPVHFVLLYNGCFLKQSNMPSNSRDIRCPHFHAQLSTVSSLQTVPHLALQFNC